MSRVCRLCGKPLPPDRRRRTICLSCALTNVFENARQLQEHKGPFYEKWKSRVTWAEKPKKEEE